MSIFNNYPKINYKIDDFDHLTAIDITNNFRLRKIYQSYRGISFQPYVVQDGERPDLVSQKLYGTPQYDWIILFVNNIHSIYDEWPRDRETLKKYIIEKYGSLAIASSTVQHYYDADDNIIDLTSFNALPSNQRSFESAYEYEIEFNIEKSIIKQVSLSVAKTIETDLRTANIKPAL